VNYREIFCCLFYVMQQTKKMSWMWVLPSVLVINVALIKHFLTCVEGKVQIHLLTFSFLFFLRVLSPVQHEDQKQRGKQLNNKNTKNTRWRTKIHKLQLLLLCLSCFWTQWLGELSGVVSTCTNTHKPITGPHTCAYRKYLATCVIAGDAAGMRRVKW